MANYRIQICAAIVAALQMTFSVGARPAKAADAPNRASQSDVAAGQWVDALLGPDVPNKLRQKPVAKKTAPKKVVRRPQKQRVSNSNQQATKKKDNQIRLAQSEEPIPAGEPVLADEADEADESSILTETPEYAGGEGLYFDDGPGIDFGGCPTCGDFDCGTCCSGGPCGFGARGVFYVHGEYLSWWMEGMNTPPLVTQVSADTTGAQPVLIPGSAVTLYGGNRILEDTRNGGRIRIGLWLDDFGKWGLEGEYLGLDVLDERFTAGLKDGNAPPGNPALFIYRPYFATTDLVGGTLVRGNALEDVDTNRLDGTVTVESRSEFHSAGIRLRHNMCCRPGCTTCCGDAVGCGSCVSGCGSGVGYIDGPLGRLCNLLRNGTRRTDLLYGVRWTGLDESLQIIEDLEVTEPGNPSIGDEIDVVDTFGEIENDFFGGEIGFTNEWEHNRWSLQLLSKVAIGNTQQRVSISGSTTTTTPAPGSVVSSEVGGLLTQGPNGDYVGNIGVYERDEFSMIPELGLTAGYQFNHRLRFTVGYTLIYWSNVVRPGDQIDLNVNPNLIPQNGPPAAGTVVQDDEPRFAFRQTDLWLQGVNVGAQLNW